MKVLEAVVLWREYLSTYGGYRILGDPVWEELFLYWRCLKIDQERAPV